MRWLLKHSQSSLFYASLFLLSILFVTIINSNNTFALQSYTYTFDSSNISSSTNFNTTYLWVDPNYSYTNSNLSSFTNPFSFVPTYCRIDFNNIPSNLALNSYLSILRLAIPSSTSSGYAEYVLSLFTKLFFQNYNYFIFPLDKITFSPNIALTSSYTTLGGSYLSLANFPNGSGTDNPYKYINQGLSISITFYDSNPVSSGGITPSGSITLTDNGIYDVTNYAEAVVDVPPVMGDYHDDLVAIKSGIYTCAAVLLVLYFFYCIYRMIIKGVKK